MKKRLSLLIALVMLIAFALPTLAACDTDKVVEKIEVLDPKTEFILGENNTIDYDNLQLKVTYEDGTSDVKTVKQWGAECTTPADLSKEGTSTYIISYGGKEAAVTVTVKVADAEKSETVTVTYKYNNGDPDHTASITKGGKAALSNPTRDGYTFDGWFVKDGTASGDWGEIWNADNPVNDDLILYAKWTKNIVTYTVTFNDGQQTTQQSVTEGGFVSFPEVKRPDATLDGWYTQNGTETGEWGDKWEETTPVTDNLTLYAKWTQVEYSHIMFNYLDNKTPTSFADIVKGTSETNCRLPRRARVTPLTVGTRKTVRQAAFGVRNGHRKQLPTNLKFNCLPSGRQPKRPLRSTTTIPTALQINPLTKPLP